MPDSPKAPAIVFSSSSSSDLRSIRISSAALRWLTIRLAVNASRSFQTRQGTVSTPMSNRISIPQPAVEDLVKVLLRADDQRLDQADRPQAGLDPLVVSFLHGPLAPRHQLDDGQVAPIGQRDVAHGVGSLGG